MSSNREGCAGRLVKLLAAGPKTVVELAAGAGVSRNAARIALENNPQLFERVDTPGRHRDAPAAWRLVAVRTGAGRPPCAHCGHRVPCRPRGLCTTCFGNLDIRARYATSSHPHTRRGAVPDTMARSRLPDRPTAAPPGSLAKMREMQRRVERGESLFHPDDNLVVDPALCNPFAGLPSWHDDRQPTGLEPETGSEVA